MKYDVIIIGGGPSGSTLARLLSDTNLSIALINGQNEKNKKPCGGLLAPDAQKELACFDMQLPSSVLVSPQIFSVKTIDLKSKLIRHYRRCYLNVDRYLFDKWLLSQVPSNIKIINSFCNKIDKIDYEYIITLKNNKTIKTKYLVGADGANSIVRKTFFKKKVKKYIAIQEWYEAPKYISPFYSCIFDPLTSESCSWSLNKDNYLIYGGAFNIKNSNNRFDEQKHRLEEFLELKLGKPLIREACLVVRPRKYSDFCTGKDNIFLVGEAASFISPSSFEGISYALKSAKLLAESFNCKNISKTYKRKTFFIKIKLLLKTFKRYMMYTYLTRYLIMKSNVKCIKIIKNKQK